MTFSAKFKKNTKTHPAVIPKKCLFCNFIHCTKQEWNHLDTDVTELEKQTIDFH